MITSLLFHITPFLEAAAGESRLQHHQERIIFIKYQRLLVDSIEERGCHSSIV